MVDLNDNFTTVDVPSSSGYVAAPGNERSMQHDSNEEMKISVPLIKLAYARSGDKGDHANIGVIARKAHYFPFIDNALNPDSISKYFSTVLKGSVLKWIVPGINGINFLLKNSLGGGGMASLNIDPQGKAYAQQLLEYPIPVSSDIIEEIKMK